MTLWRPRPARSSLGPVALAVVLGTGGCAVSFDGYVQDEGPVAAGGAGAGGTGGVAGSGTGGAAGAGTGGVAGAGATGGSAGTGGVAGTAGAAGAGAVGGVGGGGGTAGTGGSAGVAGAGGTTGGAGGATGGTGGVGGSTGGTGGSTGGTGGSTGGTGGVGGSTGGAGGSTGGAGGTGGTTGGTGGVGGGTGGAGGTTGGTGGVGGGTGGAGGTTGGTGGTTGGTGGSTGGTGGTTGGTGGVGGSTGGTGGATGGTGGTGGATGGTGGTGGMTSCPIASQGPQFVQIPTSAGGLYCIDRTEVTNTHYAAFLASSPDPSAQPPECTGNTVFTPSAACSSGDYDPTNYPTHPVTCVDWCDAAAYCAFAGKRLCGAIGTGAANPTATFADPDASEWYRACSLAGTLQFPYGNTYNGLACHGLDDTAGLYTVGVTTKPLCLGGYPGLYDMSGNAWEWENSCNGDQCAVRGGGWLEAAEPYTSHPFTLRCHSGGSAGAPTAPSLAQRLSVSRERGFRCCL